MAILKSNNMEIVGMSCAVPKNTLTFNVSVEHKIDYIKTSKIKEKHISFSLTGLDLAYRAAEQLILDLKWDKNEIDAILFAGSFPDYVVPNNACILQAKLGLKTECYAHDIPMDPNGWSYGLMTASTLLENSSINRVILLTGVGRIDFNGSNQNKLIGHGATATAIERTVKKESFCIYIENDITNVGGTVITQYGMRTPRSIENLKSTNSSDEELATVESYIDASELKDFALRNVPNAIDSFLKGFNCSLSDYDYIVFHQMNNSVNELLYEQLGEEDIKLLSSFENYGDTLSSSIPLSIIVNAVNLNIGLKRFLCISYGALQTCVFSFSLNRVFFSELIEVE